MINLTEASVIVQNSKIAEGEQAVVVDNQGTTTSPSAQPFEVGVGSVGADLLRALEAGMLDQAVNFMDHIDDQLSDELLTISSFIKKTAASKNVVDGLFDDLTGFGATMARLSELFGQVQARVDALDKGEVKTSADDDVPICYLNERVRELRRGLVVYARRVSELASQLLATTPRHLDDIDWS